MSLIQSVETCIDRRVVKLYFFKENNGYERRVPPSGIMILEVDDYGLATPSAFITNNLKITPQHWQDFISILAEEGVIEMIEPDRPDGHLPLVSITEWINRELSRR